MERGDASTSKSQRSLEMYPSPCSRLHDNLGNCQKGKDEIETKFDKRLCSRKLTTKDVWKKLKGHLEGHESYTNIFFLTLVYTTKLEDGTRDVDGCVKLVKTMWRRLSDVNLKLPEELVVLMTLMGFRPSFGPKEEFCKLEETFSSRLSRKTVEDRSVASMNVPARLVESNIAAQAGEEEEASGKPEASKRQAKSLDQSRYSGSGPGHPGNKASSISQIPTLPTGYEPNGACYRNHRSQEGRDAHWSKLHSMPPRHHGPSSEKETHPCNC